MVSLLRFFNETRSWSALSSSDLPNPITARLTITYSPIFDLAGGFLSSAIIIPLASSITAVPAGDTFSVLRISQTSGADNNVIGGAGTTSSGIYSALNSNSSSDSTSSVYGAVLHASNDGPGTVRGVHAEAHANSGSGSTGVCTAVGAEVIPIATTNTGSGCYLSSLVSATGLHGIVSAYTLLSTGDQFLYGVGTAIGPVPIKTAFYQAWIASTSAAGARAFQTLADNGTELSYIDQVGAFHAPASTTTQASINIPSGTAPTSPVNGDIWFDGSNLKIRISGVTKTFTVT